MGIALQDNTTYTLKCIGPGGATTGMAGIAVLTPPPPAVPVTEAPKPKTPAAMLCKPAVIDIQFDTNKADIKPRYHEELKKLGDFLKEFPEAKGSIEGHTDSVGTKSANMKLSLRRAKASAITLSRTSVLRPNASAPRATASLNR